MRKYYVSIPHQFPAQLDYCTPGEYTADVLVETFSNVADAMEKMGAGDPNDPDDAAEFAENCAELNALFVAGATSVVEFEGPGDNDHRYERGPLTPDQIEQIRFEQATADIHAAYVFETLDALAAWADAYTGHQADRVRALVAMEREQAA